jgi:L-alanine-DL-glutamate epimerase-like enolase superfamily enzyme
MPIVTGAHLYAVDLPFRTTFRHAAASRRTSESLFLRVQVDTGAEGWGECLPRAYVSGETREDAFALLRDDILPGLLGQSFASLEDISSFLEKCDGKAPPDWVTPGVPQSSAWSVVDLALIDAFGKASNEAIWPLATGAENLERYRYSGVVSADRGWPFIATLLKMRAFGFPHVKLKVGRKGAQRAGRISRRMLGQRVNLRVDANMAWTVEEALDLIPELRALGIEWFEQPVAAGDIDGLARLVRESSAGVVVDEGLTDRQTLEELIIRRAATGVNVRISKCGGLVAALARCHEALDADLMLQVGCQVGESSLLSAAHVTLLSALAARHPGVRFAEGCFGRHLLRDDPVTPAVQFRYGGRAPSRPIGPGLGVHVDPSRLARWVVREAKVS